MNHANDNHTGPTYLSVCSGIEAASVAWHPLGWKAVAYSEIEKFPSAVLKHHYPDTPNLGDFTKIDVRTLGRVDILAGGTPCQAFSVAGLRQSLADARGNLSLEFVRLAHELSDNNGLRNVVWENVVGVLSTKDNAFGCFLAGLVGADSAIEPPRRGKWGGAGMVSGPKGTAAWRVLDAQYFGVAQRRRRVIVVADFGNGADPAAVLFEQDGMRRHSPPSREKGKDVTADVAPSLVSSGRGVARTGDTRGQDPVVAVLRGHSDYGSGSPTLRANGGDCAGGSEALVFNRQSNCEYHDEDIASTDSARDYKSPTDLVAIGVHGEVAHTLKAEGADASEDGTGRGTPIIAFDCKGTQVQFTTDGTMTTLRSMGHAGSHQNAGGHAAVAFVQNSRDEVRLMGGDGQIVGALAAETGAKQQCYVAHSVEIRGRDGGATAELGGEVATALRASQGGGDKPHVLAFADVAPTLKRDYGKGYGDNEMDGGGLVGHVTSAVRRLTPVECERLQGFPDKYTAIPWRGKDAEQCPDGPRYKALGNSWAVPKFTWLGKRLSALLAANDNSNLERAA